jgi:hypothetical protein
MKRDEERKFKINYSPLNFNGIFYWYNSKYRSLDSLSFWGVRNKYLKKCDY